MAGQFGQACFQIERADNVCTALADLAPGAIKVNGNAAVPSLTIAQAIKSGHKLANRAIAPGEPILKYGVVIGKALRPIVAGEWVHLHNCRSLYDERSGSLDLNTGAPTDTKCE